MFISDDIQSYRPNFIISVFIYVFSITFSIYLFLPHLPPNYLSYTKEISFCNRYVNSLNYKNT